ncbi:hypothetical protein QYF36_010869 [Acer negundo]|nr:hypothetical protein QYF36_010869 [Acer negundo]
MAASLLFLGLLMSFFNTPGIQVMADDQICPAEDGAHSIGVCYGRVANDLPTDDQVVNLFHANGIYKMRLYDPNESTLQALKASDIELMLGVPNENLQALSDPSAAKDWVQRFILPYSSDVKFRYIVVGNEIKYNDLAAQYVLPAMQNMYDAIKAANLQGQIGVSTSIEPSLLGSSYPPSSGSFSTNASPYIVPIVQFLMKTGDPLLANIYPYFGYVSDPADIKLEYALFTSPGPVVIDGQFKYQNLFHALLDALYAALEKAGAPSLKVVVSETGWPSDGGNAATVENARTYYRNVIDHVKSGTPRRPGEAIETYLFAMFDENQKGPAETERHFGLFSPSMQSKYQITFN